VAVWWIRRDLRLADNLALDAAMAQADTIVPLFILDPGVLGAPAHNAAHKRLEFLFDGLRRLDADLRARGSRLIVRRGAPLAVFSGLHTETRFSVIVAAEDVSPYARHRDAQVAQCWPLSLVGGLCVHPPAAVVKANGQPYVVLTPFCRAWKALPAPAPADLLSAPQWLPSPSDIPAEGLPPLGRTGHFVAGEACAHAALRRFTQDCLFAYAQGRNRLDGDGTSGLSPYPRFGMLSARQAVVAAQQAKAATPDDAGRRSAEAWLNELTWRDFYNAILYHFPHVLRHAFRPERRPIQWADAEAGFAAWCLGRNGYPVVDAAMRQLSTTGWMHNRARMLVASFLVKDLLIDWRRGERWFMEHLVDGDPAANNGGWQWVAGVGAGAAPYFRVFNPVRQARLFDPAGDFARSWLPELRRVPDAHIHEPWKMPPEAQRRARCVIGQDYPYPIVNHAFARQRALAAYRFQVDGD
jgi:deoxyribodipyrimidine photo-lyase